MRDGDYDMVVLDEILGAVHAGLVPQDELLELVRTKPPLLHLVLTGRNAPPELVEWPTWFPRSSRSSTRSSRASRPSGASSSNAMCHPEEERRRIPHLVASVELRILRCAQDDTPLLTLATGYSSSERISRIRSTLTCAASYCTATCFASMST